ncbi:deoxyribose-phosphate aldolase [Anoxynatronum buryatiense]|uniref:Deoxyribose-phosphate aldolase n=1 Tax=Anoxynatronum buryatiense TaxID=489973 RepID=A0AA45WWX3_9CLOT|nr:deoxyribose-phosphate aldolase [Anoxynatronum buryatiense]SMP61363.1 deoxyribose-phosphate aldolase [Anoxynatronum buryatiense]
MEKSQILKHVDHTLLKPLSDWKEISRLCEEAIEYQTASVCIPPAYVERIHQTYGEKLTICTVIGFPLGYQTTAVKVAETAEAVMLGAAEVDMVINLGAVKNGDFESITREIAAVKAAAGDRIVKVIIETCYLDEAEKIRLCQCVTEGGADYIKTSTGFGTAGATLEDVHLFRKHIGQQVKIKAAGGIRSKEDLEAFIEAGCQRIGTSGAVALLTGGSASSY